MSRCLVTFATGTFEPLLDLSLPGITAYANRHGYELRIRPPSMLTRPPAWGKVLTILDALEQHQEVLWIDCDVVVLDDSVDLADRVPTDAWQAITRHFTYEGEVPSTGVWYVRRPMQDTLQQMWTMTRHMHHPWWEQAALQDLLGYTPNERPVRLDEPTALFDRTHWLDADEWNALAIADTIDTSRPWARFAHCGPGMGADNRARIMRSLIERRASEQVSA